MGKVYSPKEKEILWQDDITPIVEEAWFEICDILAVKKLDGHDIYDQWLMKVEIRLRDLVDALNSYDYKIDEEINKSILG